jgi:hypothetical protein
LTDPAAVVKVAEQGPVGVESMEETLFLTDTDILRGEHKLAGDSDPFLCSDK